MTIRLLQCIWAKQNVTQCKCLIDRAASNPALTAEKPLRTESTVLAAFTLHHLKCIVVEAGLRPPCLQPNQSRWDSHWPSIQKSLGEILGQWCHQPDFHHRPLIWSVTGQGDTERSPPINSQRWGHFTLYKRETLYIYLYNSSGYTAAMPDEPSRLIRRQSQEKCQQRQTGR